jgi:hypothetical protein
MGPTRLSMLTLACLMLCVGTLGFWWRSRGFIDTVSLGSVNVWTVDGKVAVVANPKPAGTFNWISQPRPTAATLDWPTFRYHPASVDPVTGRTTAAGFVVPLWFFTVLLVLPPLVNSHLQHRRNLRKEIE